MAQTIRNPVEWVVDEIREVAGGVGQASRSVQHTSTHLFSRPLAVSHITVADLKEVLAKGFDDFMAYRTDIIFLIAVYPIISLLSSRRPSATSSSRWCFRSSPARRSSARSSACSSTR